MRLVQVFGAANPDIHAALKYFGGPEKTCEALDNNECRNILSPDIIKRAEYVTLEKMDKVMAECQRREIKLLSIYDKEYPRLLKEIFNPPVLLFYRGDLSCLDRLCITAVGARKITPYIEKLSARIISDLVKNNVTVVSGMARGVDSVVINTCLGLMSPVVGVLACGIEYDYPRGSAGMRRMIIENGGLYMTELLPGVSPSENYFNARNRIMAGLSSGTAVFQAGVGSGSLITASYAVDEGRDVFCVPPPDIFDPCYEGIVPLLRDGAVPLFNHDDILSLYRNNF